MSEQSPSSDSPADKGAKAPLPLSPQRIVQAIKAGNIHPQSVKKPVRMDCVEFLINEGVKPSEIADLFQCDSVTIRRDRKDILARNAIRQSPQLADEIVGEIRNDVDWTIQQLKRLLQNPSLSAGDRNTLIRSVLNVREQGMRMLQSLGHVPDTALRIQAQVTVSEQPSLSSVTNELERLSSLGGTEPEVQAHLNQVRRVANTARKTSEPSQTTNQEKAP